VLRGLFIGVLILSSLVPKSAANQITQQFRNIASEKYADNFAAKSFCFKNSTQQYQKKNYCQNNAICLQEQPDCLSNTALCAGTIRFVFHAYKSEVFFHFTDSSPPDIF